MKLKKVLLVFNVATLTTLLFFTNAMVHALTNKDYTVQARVVVTKSPPSISIRWPKIATEVTNYYIYRKAKDAQSWGEIKDSVAGSDTIWTDTDVVVGEEYEYNIQKMKMDTLLGITYILSGIEIPVIHNRGSALVVVEKELASSIPVDLNNFMMDIAADGWRVFSVQVSKTDSVQFVNNEIKRYAKIAGDLKSIVLLGHVPVPYSGNFGKLEKFRFAPDGHTEHNGCWPADVYYAIDYDNWTDTVKNTDATRNENKNLPGDGKFDQTKLPANAKYFLGRIDLSDLPTFPLSEVELTKRYIKKAHDFRYKITKTVEKGVVDDRFDVSYGANGSLAWRNFCVMFGPNNIIEGDMINNCAIENLLFAYGAGGGNFTFCGRVCSTYTFITNKPAIFNMLFGSMFGDWDNTDNMLRAPLAAPENGLTNSWSGRPHWQNHPMALGEPIGYCTMITQNNDNLYTYNYAANGVHIALMGDPTLRLHIVEPPSNVSAKLLNNNSEVELSWTRSKDPVILGYYIYRSDSPYGAYNLINLNPNVDTIYIDNSPLKDTNYYLIKTLKLTASASGNYFNTSYGAFTSINNASGVSVKDRIYENQEIDISPNPASDFVVIRFRSNPNESVKLTIINSLGQELFSQYLSNSNSYNLDIKGFNQGIYYCIIESGKENYSQKLIILN